MYIIVIKYQISLINLKIILACLTLKNEYLLTKKVSLAQISENDITTEINNSNPRKPTTFNNIPVKLIKENCDICTPHNEKSYKSK